MRIYLGFFHGGVCAPFAEPAAAQYPESSVCCCRVIPLARLPSALQGYVAAAPGTPGTHSALGQGPAPSLQPLDGVQGPQELGPPPVQCMALAVLPHWAPRLSWVPPWAAALGLKGCSFSLAIGDFSSLPFLNLSALRLQVKCVSAHSS